MIYDILSDFYNFSPREIQVLRHSQYLKFCNINTCDKVNH